MGRGKRVCKRKGRGTERGREIEMKRKESRQHDVRLEKVPAVLCPLF